MSHVGMFKRETPICASLEVVANRQRLPIPLGYLTSRKRKGPTPADWRFFATTPADDAQRETGDHRMRTPLSFLIGLFTVATAVALGILVVQNDQEVFFSFLGNTLQAPQGWAVAGAAALGFLLAYLLLIPGRLASIWRTWWLGRQTYTLETKLLTLQEEHARLQGSHHRLLEEHRHVVDQVLASAPAAPTPSPEAAPAAPAEAPA
jgi:uncharacterized integral membrane protein